MSDGPTISTAATLDPTEASTVAELVGEAAALDGFSALNESALLQLRHPHPEVLHVLARFDGALVGYAQLEPQTPAAESTARSSTGQLVVHPQRRRQGVGSALLQELAAAAPSRLQLWAMGNTSAARALATRHGLVPARELLIMTRPLVEPVPQAALPSGTVVRPFVVGQDEDAWLRVNARAFHEHPEQGRLTRTDLEERLAEDWFDPAGFLLAVRKAGLDEHVTGFHWTKQHPDQLGEVYVLGVDPSAGGGGLGKALLARGLEHLRLRGNTSVQLYVEADHGRAVALYAGYGFTVASRDVMYAQS